MGGTDCGAVRRRTTAFIIGAAGTFISGVLVQLVVVPSTNVSRHRFSYPWKADASVVVSLLYLVLHLLVVDGLITFGRRGVAGPSRVARIGVALAVAGTLLFGAGQLASIPARAALADDTSAVVAEALFVLGSVLSAIGLLMIGKATLSAGIWHGWRRYTPLVAGLWTTVLVGLGPTAVLAAGLGLYGACLLAMAIALFTDTVPARSHEAAGLQLKQA